LLLVDGFRNLNGGRVIEKASSSIKKRGRPADGALFVHAMTKQTELGDGGVSETQKTSPNQNHKAEADVHDGPEKGGRGCI